MAGLKKRQSVDRRVRTPYQTPRTLQGFLQSLTLDNPTAAAALRHQCEEGTVPVSLFIKLLDRGYRKPPQGEATSSTRMPFIGKDGRPWDWEQRQRDAQTPQTTQIRSFTLENPVVRKRLQQEWEDGIMPPTIYNWFIENGWEKLRKQIEPRFRMPYVGRHGLPWQYDPMAEQEREALAAQAARNKAEELARPAHDEEQKELVVGEQEAGETNELEVYRG